MDRRDVELKPAPIFLNAVTTSHTDVGVERPEGMDEIVAFLTEVAEALAEGLDGFCPRDVR